jgi:hypothetical protein
MPTGVTKHRCKDSGPVRVEFAKKDTEGRRQGTVSFFVSLCISAPRARSGAKPRPNYTLVFTTSS